MPRSLKVRQGCIEKVKLAVRRNGFPSQRALAEDVGLALATVSNFLTGKPVDFTTFEELCSKLMFSWREIADLDFDVPSQTSNFNPETPQFRDAKPDKSPPYPNGPVPLDSHFYIDRPPMEQLSCNEILKPGSVTRIQAPRKMGKSSLLLRILAFAQQQSYKIVKIDFQEADKAVYAHLNKFLRWFCANIARQLQLQPLLDEYWDEEMGSKVSCGIYFEGYLLGQVDTPIVLVLNEINLVFEHPDIAEEFLPLLRFWHEQARQSTLFQKLRLVVVHSTEVYISLDINQSPFNIGLPIKLPEFNFKQIQDLVTRHGLNWTEGDRVEQLMAMVGGHPYLVRIALYHLAQAQITLETLLQQAPTQGGIYGGILRHHWEIIQKKPTLSAALHQVVMTRESVKLDPIVTYKLESMGLVKLDGDRAYPSCQMYRLYFAGQYQQEENRV
ncbi:MAG: serine/threonine protein kinase [Okeania sp. SIO3B5]|uniref:AAA-like domain-containing protein n=1 Tax=Okeania sp. SIO3B5 TaxID=2607811 RepID=UPI001401363A|nr:AAA-like domain-containing protein [Okeania sp. SIO3B5]NEO54833.1 serine/threonine protein kinase [Okeania sp. SIO3B5]